jgi:hypothetical protein
VPKEELLLIGVAVVNPGGELSGKFPASSRLNECGKWSADATEALLAHVEANAGRKAYARAEYWARRDDGLLGGSARRIAARRNCCALSSLSDMHGAAVFAPCANSLER